MPLEHNTHLLGNRFNKGSEPSLISSERELPVTDIRIPTNSLIDSPINRIVIVIVSFTCIINISKLRNTERKRVRYSNPRTPTAEENQGT